MTKRFLVVRDNAVVNVIAYPDDATMGDDGTIHIPGDDTPHTPEAGSMFMAQDGAGIGWQLDGRTLVAPQVMEPEQSKPDLVDYANRQQWSLATGGHQVTIGGHDYLFPSDDVTMAMLVGKAMRLQGTNPPATVVWQMVDTFITISKDDFPALLNSMTDWQQSTFDALVPVLAAIDAGTIKTYTQVRNASWPTP